jgi:hypothetical protein
MGLYMLEMYEFLKHYEQLEFQVTKCHGLGWSFAQDNLTWEYV